MLAGVPMSTAPEVVAASYCSIARMRGGPGAMADPAQRVTSQHPVPCRYCPFEMAALFEAIALFTVVDGRDHIVSGEFRRLSRPDQQALVAEAARSPMTPAPEPLSHDDEVFA